MNQRQKKRQWQRDEESETSEFTLRERERERRDRKSIKCIESLNQGTLNVGGRLSRVDLLEPTNS